MKRLEKYIATVEATIDTETNNFSPKDYGFLKGLKRAKSIIELDQPKWISVDDALPEIPEGEASIRVLTYEGKLEGAVRVSDFYYIEVGMDNFTHSFLTHWQPLQTPPEAK